MPEQFVFPDFKTVYKDAPKFQIQHLKFSLRRLFTRRQVKDFETFVNASAPRRTFFQRRPQDAYPLIHAFVDQRFNRRRPADSRKTVRARNARQYDDAQIPCRSGASFRRPDFMAEPER